MLVIDRVRQFVRRHDLIRPGARVLAAVSGGSDSVALVHILRTLAEAEPGTAWAVGTELNLVRRLAADHPDKTVVFLDRTVCFCSTMNRIDLPHLVWALESLAPARPPSRG